MAIEYGDGKAGQYAKTQAHKQFERAWRLIVFFATIPMLLIGICIGFMLAHQLAFHFVWARRITFATMIWIPLVAGILIIVGLMFSLRIFRRPVSYFMRERIKWLRGGQTEALVAWMLLDLDDNWHVFNNVKLKNGGDLDHVLIGPDGVFCISTKAHKGTYSISANGAHLLNGQPTDELEEAKRLSLRLRNWFEVKLNDNAAVQKIPWVQPVLAVPFAWVDFPSQKENVWVMSDDALLETLGDAPRRMNAATITACVGVLQEITQRSRKTEATAT